MKSARHSSKLDNIGMTASVLCAIHCAVVPMLITVLPLIGLGFLANPLFEWSMIIFALFIGVFAIGQSYFRQHHKLLPPVLLLLGFAVIITGHVLVRGAKEALVVPLGGLLIATAHFFNYRYSGACRLPHPNFGLMHSHNHFDEKTTNGQPKDIPAQQAQYEPVNHLLKANNEHPELNPDTKTKDINYYSS